MISNNGLLYIAAVDLNPVNKDGVAKKIYNQVKILNKYFSVRLIGYCGKDLIVFDNKDYVILKNENSVHRRKFLYRSIDRIAREIHVSGVYIRYPLSDYSFLSVLKKIKKFSNKIVIEIPTYPYLGNTFHSFKNFVINAIDYVNRPKLLKYVDRIVTYSDDDEIFGVKTIRTINGVIFDEIVPVNKVSCTDTNINMIAVSAMFSCHGYDRLIEGMNLYYKNGGQKNILFNVVGEGTEFQRYKTLVEKYKLDKHVVLHGFLSGEKLDSLYNEADIAVNSLAIHRIHLQKESTIKTKEYAAKGLPIISSYEVDSFSQKDNEGYVQIVPMDETPINIEMIIKFYEKIYLAAKDRNMVVMKIREDSKKICDMEVTLRKVIEYLQSF